MDGALFISIFDSIPLWVMILPIFLCSVIAVAVMIERVLFYKRIDLDYSGLLDRIMPALRSNRADDARKMCEGLDGPLVDLILKVMDKRAASDQDVMIRNYSEETVRHIEKYGGTISTIATVAPMLGLLGTVTGMMKSFSALSQFGSSVQAQLAGGITEALITTALGLFVAIPAVIFYNYMVSMIERYVRDVETIAGGFLELEQKKDEE